ncbi:adenylyl cyclase-associated protein 1 [Anolis sagrei]|uniref:adenylyl cyclase-associated protein 1 n=1 Tax=Anolis sagrei TaxID=38937 RepID=UPI0035210ABB
MTELQNLVERLERAVGHLEMMSYGPGGHGSCGDSPQKGLAAYVQAFDALLAGPVTEYMKISKEIGGDVQKHADMVHAGLMTERALLVTASQCQQPAANNFSSLLKPISDQIQVVQNFRDKNRGSKLFNHLSTVGESIPALGWVAMAPKPVPYVKEMTDAAMFYSNRVLKEYKDVDKKHVDWVKAYLSIWTELQAYIKEYHTTGLSWSKTGPMPSDKANGSQAPSPAFCGGPPPPPPGPPPPPAPAPASSGSDDPASRSALFAQINQGEGITSGLKHVSDDMKTHKNPTLKNQGGAIRTGPKPFTAPKPAGDRNTFQKPPVRKEPPMLELEGKKWRVENHENASNLVISDTELKQVAYVYKCVNSMLHIKGKINSVTLDNCKKVGLVFDDVVGIVEIINSRDIQVQVMGKVPTISINKTDGCHVYLSKDSLNCEIVSAKSSEMNVLIPTESGDFNEFPIPEQFKTLWNGKKLVTTVTEIAG